MTLDATLRVLALCVLLACAETLHGIARTVLVAPRIGKERALKLSALTGALIAFLMCWVFVPPLDLSGRVELLLLGIGLAAFMAFFDLIIGRLVMRRPWKKLLQEFNPATGNYLTYGLLFLVITPALVHLLRAR